MIREICALHDIGGTVWVDGLSALLNCTDIDYVVKPTAPHFDLITATRAISNSAQLNGYRITSSGIKTTTPMPSFDRWATLNIEMDEDAKVHWESQGDNLVTFFLLESLKRSQDRRRRSCIRREELVPVWTILGRQSVGHQIYHASSSCCSAIRRRPRPV
jgi:hypothetical protein